MHEKEGNLNMWVIRHIIGILFGVDLNKEDYDKIIAGYEEEIAEHKEIIKHLEHEIVTTRLEKERQRKEKGGLKWKA